VITKMQCHHESIRLPMLNLLRTMFRTMFLSLLLVTGAAQAAMTIEIVGAGANQIPVAIVPFRAEEGLAQRITPVVSADLVRSGLFRMVDPGGMNPVPHEPEQVNYGQWKARGAEAVVIGSVTKAADGRFDIRFRVMDAVKQTQIAGFVYFATESQLRLTAHKIADVIYEKLTAARALNCMLPMLTATVRRACCPPTSLSSRRRGRRMAHGLPMFRSSRRSPWSMCSRWLPVRGRR
jgi:hypothetical protein